MPIFKSAHPPVGVPDNVTIWDYFFESRASPILTQSSSQLAGYVDAHTKARLSYGDVKRLATYVSTALSQNYGLAPGQTLSLFSQNTIWYPVMMFAAVRVGAMASGASPAYNVEEMSFALKTANARFLATTTAGLAVARKAAVKVGIPQKHIFLLEGEADGLTTISQLIELGRKAGDNGQLDSWRLPFGTSNGKVCALLSYSSGTTGLPKAIMIPHRAVIAQCLQVAQITASSYRKVVAALPFFHITGIAHCLHLPILLNAEVILLPAFEMRSFLKTVQDWQVEELLLVPPIIIRLVRDPVVDEFDLRRVKRFGSGAAPLSDEIIQLLKKKFPGTGFKQGYGMTESCSCLTAHAPSHYDFKYAHSVGTIIPSTELKIVKEDGTECGYNEPGEILGRGPQVVTGYLNNDKATRETFDEDGFLHTGDQGMIDENGIVYITDRIKEMIKVKGIGVAPAELEDLLLGHAKVEDTAVLAIPDDYNGEVPKAYVTLKPGVEKNEETGKELLKYVMDNKVRYKHIKELEFIEEIPKSPSGKILRRVLRDRAKSGSTGIVVRAPERARL